MIGALLFVLGVALVTTVFALAREKRIRRALERLLQMLLTRWKTHASNTTPEKNDH